MLVKPKKNHHNNNKKSNNNKKYTQYVGNDKKTYSFRKDLGDKVSLHPQFMHGLLIDAGSTGSRLHVFEFEPRVLDVSKEALEENDSQPLTFPNTHSRWTDRLSPGISSFSEIKNYDDLVVALRDYLGPLLQFAKFVLRSKKDRFNQFPIYLKATGGMRALPSVDRQRIMRAVRDLLHDNTFSPFFFTDEQARTISGEEEAVFGWTAINFLMGTMLKDAVNGTGAVANPAKTYGALDLGGASTQISFFEPHEDIMANLFKMQLGGERHWNIYAHSFLYFGVVYAEERLGALIASNYSQKVFKSVPHPCLPVGQNKTLKTDISLVQNNGTEYEIHSNSTYSIEFIGNGNYETCSLLSRKLLRKNVNQEWCDFAHREDCSYSGVYQPSLPTQRTDKQFGEFLGFSNFYHVWDFLKLDEKSTLLQLQSATEIICNMPYSELKAFNGARKDYFEDLNSYCFRSAYIFELLNVGYGFSMNDTITCKDTLVSILLVDARKLLRLN